MAYTTQFGYDNRGYLTHVTDPDAGVTYYTHDALGRMTSALSPWGEATYYEYDAANRPTKRLLGNGCVTYYEHDAADRVIKVENLKSDLSVISSFEYQRDLLGNPLSILREDSSCVYYEYDRNQQLTKETQTDDEGAVIYAWEWEYDAAGNRTWQGFNGVDTYYEYNNLNQLTQEATDDATTYYLYDRCGNQTAKTDGEGTTYFQWDHENLLTRIDFPDDTHSYFTYDADGKRIAKADADGYTRFIYRGPDMLALLQEKDDANDTVAHYTIGVGKGLESMRRGEASSFYHFDALGSTFNLTDALEVITDAYRYNAWGEVLARTGTTPNPHGYVGRLRYYAALEAGLLQLGLRYYGVKMGRFVSVDPFLRRGRPRPRLHSYGYGQNSPALYFDPGGLIASSNPMVPGGPVDIDFGPWLAYEAQFGKCVLSCMLQVGRGLDLMFDEWLLKHLENHPDVQGALFWLNRLADAFGVSLCSIWGRVAGGLLARWGPVAGTLDLMGMAALYCEAWVCYPRLLGGEGDR